MRQNRYYRVARLERDHAYRPAFRFVLDTKGLKRGEKPSPGSFTFRLDDPNEDRREVIPCED